MPGKDDRVVGATRSVGQRLRAYRSDRLYQHGSVHAAANHRRRSEVTVDWNPNCVRKLSA